jgi:two-component system response regulator LytT
VRALVVDDESVPRRALVQMLVEAGVHVVAEAASAAEALDIARGIGVDAAFLDIRLPEIDGLSLGDRLGRWGISVVFVTGFPDYALQAFDVPAVDYLLKPVTPDRLSRVLARVLARARGSPVVERICLRPGDGGGERLILSVRALIYATRGPEGTVVVTDSGPVRIQMALDELERALEPHGFFRAHRAFLINLHRIRRIIPWSRSASSILLDDAKETMVPLAKSRLRALRSQLLWL